MRSANRPRILIADDEPVFRSVIATQLDPHFDVVAAAADGAAAIEVARRERPDVALLDVQMPGGGPGLAAAIRAACPATAVVILSVDETRSSVLEFLRAGAVAYLRKGITAPELVSRLQQSVEIQRSQPPAAAA